MVRRLLVAVKNGLIRAVRGLGTASRYSDLLAGMNGSSGASRVLLTPVLRARARHGEVDGRDAIGRIDILARRIRRLLKCTQGGEMQ